MVGADQPLVGAYSTGHGSYSGRSSYGHGSHGDCCCCGDTGGGLAGSSTAIAAAAGAALGLLIAAAIKAAAAGKRKRRQLTDGTSEMNSSMEMSRELFMTGRWDHFFYLPFVYS